MEVLVWKSRPVLRDPLVVAAFRGWNDGGQAASLAATFLRDAITATPFCEIDPEEFYDFQEVRPHVALTEGLIRRVDWPENIFSHGPLPTKQRDCVILIGIEPQNRWRTFSQAVIDVAEGVQASMVVTLGGLLQDTPHTRPVPVFTSAEPEMAERLGLEPSRYEGPTGIVGVLHDHCRTAGIPSASLWAAVPHYIQVSPNPKAALALLRQLGEVVDDRFDTTNLSQAAVAFERQVTQAVSTDDEVSRYVRELEERADDDATDELEDDATPAGEDIAAQIERFLAEREDEK